MTSSVVLTIASCLTAVLLALVALAIAPTTWALVLAVAALVAGAALVALAVTRAISETNGSDADRQDRTASAAGSPHGAGAP